MQSMNSCFNLTLYKKQMTRFWPLWGAYGLIMVMLLPLYCFMYVGSLSGVVETFAVDHVLDMAVYSSPWIAAFAGVLGAMAVWSYLYNNRSVALLHSLPIRREGLFLTNYVAGLSFLVLPTLAVAVLTLGAEAMTGQVDLRSLGLWVLLQCLAYVFFFSMATLLAFVTGALAALPPLYVIFNGLAVGLVMILDTVFQSFVYGYETAAPLVWVRQWLTPLYAMVQKLGVQDYSYDEALGYGVRLEVPVVSGIEVVAGFAVAGLVMAGLALVLYRRRRMEMAGEVVAVPWMRPIFKYGVAVCGALTFGEGFYVLVGVNFGSGLGTLVFFLLLWGAVFYFAAEMLLQKSLRVFGDSWRGCVTLLCAIVVCVMVMEMDVTGYERNVPAAGEVQQVEVNGGVSYLATSTYIETWTDEGYKSDFEPGRELAQDPEYIARVIDLHTALVNGKREMETRLAQMGQSTETSDVAYRFWESETVQWLDIRYVMEDGSVMQRSYRVPVTELLLEDPASPAAKLNELVNQPDWVLESTLPSVYERDDISGGSVDISSLHQEAGSETAYWQSNPRAVSKEQAQLLYDAMKEDLAAGRLGRSWLLESEEFYKTQYVNRVELIFLRPYREEETGRVLYRNVQVSMALQTDSLATLAVLAQLGLVEEGDLRTWEEVNMAERGMRDETDPAAVVQYEGAETEW